MVFLHDSSLYLLYLALGLAVFLAIERTILLYPRKSSNQKPFARLENQVCIA
jgi:hypothetical protein